MDVFEGIDSVFKLIERASLTQNELSFLKECGFSWTGDKIDCDLLAIVGRVVMTLDKANVKRFNYIYKLQELQKCKGCDISELAVNTPIFGLKT